MVSEDDILAALPSLRRFAFRLCRGDADRGADLVQDTIVRALEKQHQFDGRNFRSWALRIMYTVFCSRQRRLKFQGLDDPEPLIDALSCEPAQEHFTDLRRAARGIDGLSPKHHVVIILAAHGQSYEEIAHNLRIPEGTVRSRLARARDNLEGYR